MSAEKLSRPCGGSRPGILNPVLSLSPTPGICWTPPAATTPGDWSFSDAYGTIQLEVRPSDPYSVNVWCAAVQGTLYIGAGGGASSVWAQELLDDARARVRMDTVLYDVVAARVTNTAEIEAYIDEATAGQGIHHGEHRRPGDS